MVWFFCSRAQQVSSAGDRCSSTGTDTTPWRSSTWGIVLPKRCRPSELARIEWLERTTTNFTQHDLESCVAESCSSYCFSIVDSHSMTPVRFGLGLSPLCSWVCAPDCSHASLWPSVDNSQIWRNGSCFWPRLGVCISGVCVYGQGTCVAYFRGCFFFRGLPTIFHLFPRVSIGNVPWYMFVCLCFMVVALRSFHFNNIYI